MSATSVSRRPRRSRTYWARRVSEQAASGLSMRAFCVRHDLALKTFARWKRKLEGASSSPAAFVELPVTPTPGPAAPPGWDIELELADGVRLRLYRR